MLCVVGVLIEVVTALDVVDCCDSVETKEPCVPLCSLGELDGVMSLKTAFEGVRVSVASKLVADVIVEACDGSVEDTEPAEIARLDVSSVELVEEGEGVSDCNDVWAVMLTKMLEEATVDDKAVATVEGMKDVDDVGVETAGRLSPLIMSAA